MSFFNELKRRNVFRVGIAYIVVAWLVLQVADVVLNNIEAPGWVFQVIMLVLGIGFPLVLVFAWAFEMTPEGIKKEKDVDRSQSITTQTGRKLDRTIIAVLVVALGYFIWESRFRTGPAIPADTESRTAAVDSAAAPGKQAIEQTTTGVQTARDNSIAVLPFADMSPNKDQEYFTDGLSEELLNLLAKIPELKVAARTSSFQFKNKSGDMADIGKQLKVANILEGSVRKAGDRVRITAQLIKTEDGYHLWSETWDRTLDDVFAIQDEIALAVADALKITLLGEAPTVNETVPEAYSRYLQGRYFFNQGNDDNWVKAQAEYEQALVIDPGYAAAWAGLSEVLWSRAGYGYMDFETGMAAARTAVEKALALDPDLAAGWVNLAQLLSITEWDYTGAGAAIDRALALEPGNGMVQFMAGNYAKYTGRFDEAITHYRKAIELDPMSQATLFQLTGALIATGQLDEAEATVRQALYMNPDTLTGHSNLAAIFSLKGQHERALAEAELEADETWRNYQLAHIFHSLGRQADADAVLQRYIEKNHAAWAYQIGEIYAFRGEYDKAFDWLERAREQRDPGFSWLLSDTDLRVLHSDPRWEPLVESVGLLDAWKAMPVRNGSESK